MSDDPSDDADRLEQALERIAALAARRGEPAPAATIPEPNAALAARLDELIARLRATLSGAGA